MTFGVHCRYTDLIPQDKVHQVEASQSGLAILEEEEDEGHTQRSLEVMWSLKKMI